MAHFAEIDNNNVVINVVVIDNANIVDQNGVENENIGIAYCQSLFGSDTKWVQTSYNHKIRNKYAGIGDIYHANIDKFALPAGPYPSWVLDNTGNWVSPVPQPSIPAGYKVLWNELDKMWVLVMDAKAIP